VEPADDNARRDTYLGGEGLDVRQAAETREPIGGRLEYQ
jgi:hypothetical protein